jgi:hypothetical protein
MLFCRQECHLNLKWTSGYRGQPETQNRRCCPIISPKTWHHMPGTSETYNPTQQPSMFTCQELSKVIHSNALKMCPNGKSFQARKKENEPIKHTTVQQIRRLYLRPRIRGKQIPYNSTWRSCYRRSPCVLLFKLCLPEIWEEKNVHSHPEQDSELHCDGGTNLVRTVFIIEITFPH